jgi:hypothetical protein
MLDAKVANSHQEKRVGPCAAYSFHLKKSSTHLNPVQTIDQIISISLLEMRRSMLSTFLKGKSLKFGAELQPWVCISCQKRRIATAAVSGKMISSSYGIHH